MKRLTVVVSKMARWLDLVNAPVFPFAYLQDNKRIEGVYLENDDVLLIKIGVTKRLIFVVQVNNHGNACHVSWHFEERTKRQ